MELWNKYKINPVSLRIIVSLKTRVQKAVRIRVEVSSRRCGAM